MFLQQMVNGVMLGSIYTTIALAYTLVMGILGVLNIAVAETFTFGAFVGLALLVVRVPVPVAILGAMAAGAVLSVIIERFGYRPLKDAPAVMPLLSTIGFALVYQTVIENVWGSDPRQFPSELFSAAYHIGTVQVTGIQLWIVTSTIIVVLALSYFLKRTQMGRGLRAVAENPLAAAVLGIDSKLINVITFAISGALAGASGLLVGLNYSAITPLMGEEVGLRGVAVMVIGGVTNIWGSLVAGPLLGIAQVMAAAYLGASYQDIVVYGLLIIVLLVRPEGLLGKPNQVRRRT
ncbi:MAG TPA: branched-chain amino acid ABC transporter permease [Symbiobacteriaceae bacterium]|nr:branched-chain amino acid ABC transporter permease [Symbiobacteriaceae bacterium]